MQNNKLYLIDGIVSQEFTADDTGEVIYYIYSDDTHYGKFDNLYLLKDEIKKVDKSLVVSRFGISLTLMYGFAIPPYSLYNNLYALTIGDKLTIDFKKQEILYSVDFPYLLSKSTQNEIYSDEKLKEVISKSVEENIPQDKRKVFLQSAGKDSSALIISLNDKNIKNVECITYDSKFMEQEAKDASKIATHFNYTHDTVYNDSLKEYNLMKAFLKKSPSFNADITIPAYINMLNSVNIDKDTFLIDGSGNDVYMGYVDAKKDILLRSLSFGKYIWSKTEAINISPKINYMLKTFQMYPMERLFSGSRLAYSSIKTIFGDVEIKPFIDTLVKKYDSLQRNDAKNFYKGRVFDTVSINTKAKMIADYYSIDYSLPFCDKHIIDYYFNLPDDKKFDKINYKNKLGLRSLINKELGEYEYVKNKGSFRFNINDFIKVNLPNMQKDIKKAIKILPNIKEISNFLIKNSDNYVYAYELYTLWVTVEWLNNRGKEELDFNNSQNPYSLIIRL